MLRQIPGDMCMYEPVYGEVGLSVVDSTGGRQPITSSSSDFLTRTNGEQIVSSANLQELTLEN